MKKQIVLLFLLAIGFTAFAQDAKPQWTGITSNSPETFQTQLISSTESSIKVNVQVPGFYSATVTTPKGEANVITVPKSVSTAKAGEPDVPMTGIPVMIGDKARMNVRVLDAQYMDFENIEVAPSKGDFPRTIDPATVPYTYGECYNKDAFFPASNLDMYEPYIIRDFRGQNMAVFPFAYNPVSKTLRVYYNMTVEMYKVDDQGKNVINSRKSNEVKLDPDFKSVYQRHFINYEAGMSKYTALDEEGDLLIICYDSFINNMTDFVNWKKTRGINTTIVGTSTAGSTYTAIQSYIQSQYNANNNLSHVLLVGDVAQIPGYPFTAGGTGSGGYDGKGDNLYGQVVGSDIYNDVIIGRFSASTAARVTTQCQRAITYERDLTSSATWLKVAEGISRKEGGSGHNSEDDYQHMDNIRTDLLNYGYSPVYQRYANLSGYDGSSATISSDINSGVGIINYTNHGQETAWGANQSGYIYYANSHVNALTNENKLPFIFSVACLVGKYDHSSDCFAEAWMNATNNNNPTGAIGTLMSYISQPWIPPMWAQDECIDILVAENKQSFGGVSINGLFSIFDHYSTSENQAKGTYQAWIVYGDPTLTIRTKTPTNMTVSHAGTIAPSGGTYAVNVTNGNGALATITDANHNILGRATVNNGTANITLSGNLTVGSELTLCVFGFNKVTYLGTISVVGGTQYTINTSVNPTAGGSVTGAGTYYEDTQCTLTATANNHYEFSKWTKNGTQVSTQNPYTFTVTSGGTYTANFTALSPHTVTCSTVQNGTISASPTSAYKGETVTLTATPASGYCLGSWTVKDASNNNITVTNNQFIMPDKNVTVSATFVQGYNVTLTPATNGTISANPTSGPAGTTITLTATPATGYELSNWVVYKTGDANTTVNVSNNTFSLPAYDVTVVGIFSKLTSGDVTIGSGTSTSNGQYLPTYAYYNYSLTQQIYTASEVGTAGTITKVAFKVSNSKSTARTLDVYLSHTSSTSFSSNTGWISQSTSYRVFSGEVTFNSSGWTTITLSTPFEYNGTSNLLLTVDDNTGSYVSSSSNSPQFYTYSGSSNSAIYKYNDGTDYNPASMTTSGTRVATKNQVVFTKEVPSSEGYLTVTPTSLSGFNTIAGTASASKSVAVIGANLQANLTVTAPSGYEVSSSQNGTYNSTLTLTPSNGSYHGNVYVRLNTNTPGDYNGTMVLASGSTLASVSLSGSVAPNSSTQYDITATASPTEGGTISGAGTYYEDSTCELIATAAEGYTFSKWTKDGVQVSTNATYSFTVTEAAAYVAHFTLNTYTITATANPTEGGTITGAGTYSHGEGVVLTATANEGYTFVDWTENGTVVCTSPTCVSTATTNRTLVANFTLNSYTVNVTSNPAEYGEVEIVRRDGATLTYDFEDGTQGWTLLKGNEGNSPNNWMHNTSYPTSNNNFTTGYGHNSSDGFMLSESYISGSSSGSGSAVTPDNYLVSPQVRLGGSISFYAGARNTSYCAEKFSVMVSTTDNTNTASFTTVGTWTLSLSSAGYTDSPYTVDLSAYSGMGYIAIRHFDCYDQWFLAIDDITIVEGENHTADNGTFFHGESCTVTATPNDGYYFINWSENGSVVSTEANYTFTVTADRDLVANFSDQQTVMETQTIALVAGTNWWGTNLNITLEDLKEAIVNALGTNGSAIIKSQSTNMTYKNGHWRPTDIPFDIKNMYQITVSAACEITLEGTPVDPTSCEITIINGCNWIGFLSETSMTLNEAFSSLNPVKGDMVKSKEGSSTYNGTTWRGQVQTLEPGQGYIYQSKDPNTKTFSFPGNK